MSTKLGLSIVCVQLGPLKLSITRSSGCPLFRGCLNIEVNGRIVGLSELFVISWVSTVEGCLLSKAPL